MAKIGCPWAKVETGVGRTASYHKRVRNYGFLGLLWTGDANRNLFQLLSEGPCILLEFEQAVSHLLRFALVYIEPGTGNMKQTEIHNKNINSKPARPEAKETMVVFFSSSE